MLSNIVEHEIEERKGTVLDSDVHQRLGWNLRVLRKMRGWTQEDLAVRCGLNRAYLSNIECGSIYRNPSLGALDRLARALGIDVAELLSRPSAAYPRQYPANDEYRYHPPKPSGSARGEGGIG